MARFYSEVVGNRGPATRMGTKDSGIWGHIRGWDVGIIVQGRVNEEGEDVLDIYRSGGSRRPTGVLIATITEEKVVFHVPEEDSRQPAHNQGKPENGKA